METLRFVCLIVPFANVLVTEPGDAVTAFIIIMEFGIDVFESRESFYVY